MRDTMDMAEHDSCPMERLRINMLLITLGSPRCRSQRGATIGGEEAADRTGGKALARVEARLARSNRRPTSLARHGGASVAPYGIGTSLRSRAAAGT
jgi:hypothetical protein